MLRHWKCCSFALLSLAAFNTYAAIPVNLNHQPLSYLQSFLAAKNTSLVNTTQPQLEKISSAQDFNKTTHTRYQETFSGYSVFGGDIVVHTPQKSTLTSTASMNGILYQDLQKDLQNAAPHIFTPAHAQKALSHAIHLYGKNAETGKSKLMVYVDEQNKAHWAFYVDFRSTTAGEIPQKPTYLLDAETFQVYKHWNNIQTLDLVEGGGHGGNLKTGLLTYDSGNGHLPKLNMQRDASTQICYLQNDDVTVLNANKNNEVIQFSCKEPDKAHQSVYWNGMIGGVNFGFSPANDALYAGNIIKKMYKDWYELPVLVDDEKKALMLTMRVHDRSTIGLENAYWDPDAKMMTFGDGFLIFYPLVSLGIGAHEISHGFTSQHSNLFYDGQSGGINESFSDMAAIAAEYFSKGTNSWDVGAEVFKAKGQALRYMDEPSKDCKGRRPGNYCSISHTKNYYNGLDVHFSSGIFNKAFYLISTSENWNTKKAFDVMVQANMYYWTAYTSFTNAACGVMKATQDYQYDINAISKAFNEVGIDTTKC